LTPSSEIVTGTSAQNDPDLGVVRTMMAADRTLMAWIRTSLSMLSFGYTIYKVLQEVQDATNIPIHRTAPRNAGVFLTVAGTLALILGIAEYYGNLRMLRRSYLFRRIRPTLIMSVLMAIAGMLLSFGIIVRVL
jgi:putative membrane protein